MSNSRIISNCRSPTQYRVQQPAPKVRQSKNKCQKKVVHILKISLYSKQGKKCILCRRQPTSALFPDADCFVAAAFRSGNP